jgi:hypothetical protein
VTEQEWSDCTDPTPMLEFLRGKAGDRKLRLSAVAFCRGVWDSIRRDAKDALATVERFADGLALDVERESAKAAAAREVRRWSKGATRTGLSVARATKGVEGAAHEVAWEAAASASAHISYPTWEAGHESRRRRTLQEHCQLLRDIFGNPFRPVALDPSWVVWNDGAVLKMARTIYDQRRFSDLPLVADALEEAGCTVADILGHCRSGGEHVRGCWVMDLLLGKQ